MSVCAPFNGPKPHADRSADLNQLDPGARDEQPLPPSVPSVVPGGLSNSGTAASDNTGSCTANVQPWAQGVARGAFGAYQPSYKDFSSKPLQPLQKFMADSPGNRLADGDGRRLYNSTTGTKAAEVLAKIDAGKVTAQNGAYEAAKFRDNQALQVRRTSTSPETLAKIAGTRVDKGNDILSERVNDPAKLQQHVDAKLYPKAEAKLIEQGKPAKADAVYREIVESSGRPNAAVNADAALRSAKAEKIRGAGQMLGRTALVVGAVTDGMSLKNEFDNSRQTGNYDNTYKEGARIAGGWAGAWAGGKAGAATGAMLGGALGSVVPVLGNGVGAALGGIIGGFLGGFFGYKAGEQVGTGAYDLGKTS